MKMDLYSTGTGNLSGRIRDFGVGTKRFYLGHFFDYYYQNCYDLHFKRLDSHDPQLPIYGSPLKPLALVVSLGAVNLFLFRLQGCHTEHTNSYLQKSKTNYSIL